MSTTNQPQTPEFNPNPVQDEDVSAALSYALDEYYPEWRTVYPKMQLDKLRAFLVAGINSLPVNGETAQDLFNEERAGARLRGEL